MEITIDLQANRWWMDGVPAQGQRRWEAALLALLLRDGHHSAASACGKAKLHAELLSMGQAQALNRKQIGRLIDGLHDSFDAAGHAESFASRFRHAPRGRTVGPWWWTPQPDDQWSLVAEPAARAMLASDLPGLAAAASPQASSGLCRAMLICHGHVWDGNADAAMAALADPDLWSSASAELHALRQLRTAEVMLSKRDFGAATQAADAAQALLCGAQVASLYLTGPVLVLRQRLLYAAAPMRNYAAITHALAPAVTRPPGAGFLEVDAASRGARFNLLALCERRWLEEHGRGAADSQTALRMERAQRYWFSALFGYLVIGHHEYVQHMCANLGYFYQRMSQLGLGFSESEALDWYALARGWHNRFDLSDNVVWEYIFLGDYWLYQHSVRAELKHAVGRMGWEGRRPDELEFYVYAARRAEEIGEPRQMAHTALNLFHFTREKGQLAASQKAMHSLRSTLANHPDVARILVAEGYAIP